MWLLKVNGLTMITQIPYMISLFCGHSWPLCVVFRFVVRMQLYANPHVPYFLWLTCANSKPFEYIAKISFSMTEQMHSGGKSTKVPFKWGVKISTFAFRTRCTQRATRTGNEQWLSIIVQQYTEHRRWTVNIWKVLACMSFHCNFLFSIFFSCFLSCFFCLHNPIHLLWVWVRPV